MFQQTNVNFTALFFKCNPAASAKWKLFYRLSDWQHIFFFFNSPRSPPATATAAAA